METKRTLQKYSSRLNKQGWIKAAMMGIVVGLAGLAVFSLVCWILALDPVWIGAIVFGVFAAGSTPIFFLKIFRPTIKMTIRRIDALGLEERVLTMNELESNDSYIAKVQREDTISALKTVNAKLLKFAAPIALIIVLGVTLILSSGLTVGAEYRSRNQGDPLFRPGFNPNAVPEFMVEYDIEGGGFIYGDIFQFVDYGRDATPVMAVADDYWFFDRWSDGYENPERWDRGITEDLFVYAIFIEMEEGDGDGDGDSDGDSDSGSSDSDSNGDDGPQPPDSGGSGNPPIIQDNNAVNDGATDSSGDSLNNATNQAGQDAQGNPDSGFHGGYFDGIQ